MGSLLKGRVPSSCCAFGVNGYQIVKDSMSAKIQGYDSEGIRSAAKPCPDPQRISRYCAQISWGVRLQSLRGIPPMLRAESDTYDDLKGGSASIVKENASDDTASKEP